jgi:hypothetical protein
MRRWWTRWSSRLTPRRPAASPGLSPAGDTPLALSFASKRLIRRLTYAYIDWREECAALEAAYRRWVSADAADAELAFVAYKAALDREQRASVIYGELVSRSNEVLPDDLRPTPPDVATPRPG